MMLQFERFGIDISKDPVLIYPTLHYQNGGVKIDTNSETNVKKSFCGRGSVGRTARAQSVDGKFIARFDGFRKAVRVDCRLTRRIDEARGADAQTFATISGGSQATRECQRCHLADDLAGVHEESIKSVWRIADSVWQESLTAVSPCHKLLAISH
ncbi:MAG: hypothetical protein HC794_06080 [Nitrospiraceae bacterium]|nr:hypothetical protein [Nitrospiraceae bacterium]